MNHFDVDAVFIPNAIELRVMNCPEYACEAVIQRLNVMPPQDRITLMQIQEVIQAVVQELENSVDTQTV